MSSPVTGRTSGHGGTVKDQEIAAEQRYVDTAYERLEEMRADAQAMIREGYRQSLAGTKGSLVDRDAMVHQAALRAQALDVADDGLVFGRLDLAARDATGGPGGPGEPGDRAATRGTRRAAATAPAASRTAARSATSAGSASAPATTTPW
ncbi:hypothetical protein ACFQHO_16365 [Actinomadura yumaensis]|uniref:hypothetical protein n=1 Tax=Actinomadura yumaensis TaxID=111807 RepID=UPI003622E3A5